MTEITTTILSECADAFKSAHKSLLTGGAMLHQIRSQNLWEGQFESYRAYLDFIGISESASSKILTVYEHYCLNGGLSLRNLEGVDTEKLYLSTRLKGEPEKQLVQAQTLTRSELKAELSEKDGVECLHETTITICASCHARR